MYGTLKRDEANHHYIASDPNEYGQLEYMGQAQTVDKWPLMIMQIYGDLIRVDNKLRDRIDYLESQPCTFKYDKFEIPVQLDDGSKHNAWCYMISEFKQDLLDRETIDEFNGVKHGYVKGSENLVTNYDPNTAL
ncbi:putative gamma-glutamylcyclotransferase CG2811 [Oppia nitens]|uniref:putative gamma-glutamylcyclotransferase CG2811 n=1 Tax=Oppia nitens TaxID=1686743 RepID=UPI0023D986F9|nr:putative gamma-glutamylcyclotransferase CG2811 [Oppia nitens]